MASRRTGSARLPLPTMIPKEVFEETIFQFFEPIRPFLDDASVSEVMINGPGQIYIERKGKLVLTDATFPSREALMAALRNLSQFVGKHLSEERPILEGRLPDGSRVEALIPPVAPDGPHIAIRRFFKETLTVERLVQFGSMPGIAAASLQAFVISKLNIIIAGGTGSGKTSMLNALSGFIPDGERVVVIEDSREIQFQKPHVVQLEARPADPKGRGAVSIRDLFRATLRMRPDRVIVGEIRGGEALDIVQAMTSGHGGCMGTLHASYPRDTLTRLETMAMMSDVEMPLAAMRTQIGSGVRSSSRSPAAGRRVRSAITKSELRPRSQSTTAGNLLRAYTASIAGNLLSELVPTGILPTFMHQLEEHGVALPDPVVAAARQHAAGAAAPRHGGP